MTPNSTGPDPERIRSMFGSIAGRYDRANTILSAGVHHRWRRTTVRWSGAKAGDSVLDCATGTGDLAIAFQKVVGPNGHVVGTDFTPEMIELARKKAPGAWRLAPGSNDVAPGTARADENPCARRQAPGALTFEIADVTQLPYDTASFDISSISFGIRNVGDPRRGIAELARVVRSGGRVMVLEFGQPPNRAFRALYDLYRARVLPRLGGIVTGEQDAYSYLERSAGRFPCGDEFAQLMRESANFASVEFRPLTFGIAWLYRGVVA